MGQQNTKKNTPASHIQVTAIENKKGKTATLHLTTDPNRSYMCRSNLSTYLNNKVRKIAMNMSNNLVQSISDSNNLSLLLPLDYYHNTDSSERRKCVMNKYLNSFMENVSAKEDKEIYLENNYSFTDEYNIPISTLFNEMNKAPTSKLKVIKVNKDIHESKDNSKTITRSSSNQKLTPIPKANPKPNGYPVIKIDLTNRRIIPLPTNKSKSPSPIRNKLNSVTTVAQHPTLTINSRNQVKNHSHCGTAITSYSSCNSSVKSVPDSLKSYDSGSYAQQMKLKQQKGSLNRSYTSSNLEKENNKILFTLDLSKEENVNPEPRGNVNSSTSTMNKMKKLKNLKLKIENKTKCESPFEAKEQLGVIRESINTEDLDNERSSFNKRQTPKFDVILMNKQETSQEDERFSFNLMKNNNDRKINLNFDISEKINEDELKDLEYLDESI